MEENRTILYLHGPLVRTSRLLLEGLSAFAAANGFHVQRMSPPQGAGTWYLRRLIDFWQPLGIVEDCGVEPNMPLPDASIRSPFVCIDLDEARRETELANGKCRFRILGFVNADSAAFAQIAARELLLRDFRSYAYVSAYQEAYWSKLRERSFAEAVELCGHTASVFDGRGLASGIASGVQRIGTWLKALPKPCGLLAANDRTAALVLTAAARHGVAIPDEVGVIGIDDDEMLCENMSPQLTSIKTDFFQGGRIAGQLVADLIGKRAKSGTTLLYGAQKIVQRLSTRRLKTQTPSVRIALETIRRRVAEGISAVDILPILGGSRRSAEKRFRLATGKSILEEILDVRFEKLLSLLEQRHLPLGSLAGLVGFSSDNHLQRLFKARFGMTLTDYRRKNQVPRLDHA